MTTQELINGSLRLLGVIDPVEGPEDAESEVCLESLNAMLDSWSTERLSVPTIDHSEVLTVAGQTEYTVGATGNWEIARPIKVYELKDAGGDYVSFTADNGFPLITVTLTGDPGVQTLALYVLNPLTTPLLLTSTLAFPPGYERAIRYNLAIELIPEFAPELGSIQAQALQKIASESKTNIQRLNYQPPVMNCDLALLHNSVFDINTGRY